MSLSWEQIDLWDDQWDITIYPVHDIHAPKLWRVVAGFDTSGKIPCFHRTVPFADIPQAIADVAALCVAGRLL